MPCSGSAIDDHRWVTCHDHGRAMVALWAGHLVTNAGNAFAVRVGHDRCFDDNAAVIGLVANDNEWSAHGSTSLSF